MSKQVTKEQLREAFNNRSQNIKIQVLLNGLNQFIRLGENLPHVVNNMVDYLNEKQDTTIKTIAVAWMRELNKLLKDTYLWEQVEGKKRIATHTLPTSGVLDLVKYHYQRETKMPLPETLTESVFMDRELTEEEKTKLRMAKMSEAKRRKAEERRRKAILEEQAKQKQIDDEALLVRDKKTGEVSQATPEEVSEIEFLKNLKF